MSFTLEQASKHAKEGSKMLRCLYYVIKVRGGYDFFQKGIMTPTGAKIIKAYENGWEC